MKIITLCALIALTACDPKVPTWQEKCVDEYPIVWPQYIYNADGSSYMIMQTTYICNKSAWECFIPKDWKGERNCGERK